ncbi:unnamed protein product [Natator depressus]
MGSPNGPKSPIAATAVQILNYPQLIIKNNAQANKAACQRKSELSKRKKMSDHARARLMKHNSRSRPLLCTYCANFPQEIKEPTHFREGAPHFATSETLSQRHC